MILVIERTEERANEIAEQLQREGKHESTLALSKESALRFLREDTFSSVSYYGMYMEPKRAIAVLTQNLLSR